MHGGERLGRPLQMVTIAEQLMSGVHGPTKGQVGMVGEAKTRSLPAVSTSCAAGGHGARGRNSSFGGAGRLCPPYVPAFRRDCKIGLAIAIFFG